MAHDRLLFCLNQGGLIFPEDGMIALFGMAGDAPLPLEDAARFHAIQTFAPDAHRLRARGIATSTDADGPYRAAIVTLPRARDLAQARIAAACTATPGGLIVVDGAKTDGIDALLKAVRSRTEVLGQVSKSHGRVFWFTATDAFADWAGAARPVDGFTTRPGVFSADGPDEGSAALAAALPQKLGSIVTDLGGGWGYLAAQVLDRPGIETIHLVEADFDALTCARENLTDPRVRLFWDDATTWDCPALADTVVMNPPFHTGRKADPALGQAFIAAAARCLKPSGALWMVANRHLPYEDTLARHFRKIEEIPGAPGFKLLHGSHPARIRR